MNKKIMCLLLAFTLFPISERLTNQPAQASDITQAVDIEALTDVKKDHWAYEPVKLLVQDLGVMPPKTPTKFFGNDKNSRYEIAQIFYNIAKKLENVSRRDLKVDVKKTSLILNGIEPDKKTLVNSVVNEYGLMMTGNDKEFNGNEKMTRYEIAYELNSYLNLLEKKVGANSLASINRFDRLKDIKKEHWAANSVSNIVNKYQIMTGFPDNTFKGYQVLTRYELAAVLKKFIDYVDRYLIPVLYTIATPTPAMVVQASPTPVPTVIPTPIPTLVPVVVATPAVIALKPLNPFDLRLGGNVKPAYTTDKRDTLGFSYGLNAQANFWFPKTADVTRFGLEVNFDYLLHDQSFSPTITNSSLSRLTLGGDINWRILGIDSDEQNSLVLGLGYEYLQWNDSTYGYSNHGPKVKLSGEIPISGLFNIFASEQLHYIPIENKLFDYNIHWKNDFTIGVTIPFASAFALQVGYRDTRYSLANKTDIYGEIGGFVNLRSRF